MKGVETVPNAVKIFIGIFDRALEISLLFSSEFGSDHSVGQLSLGVLCIQQQINGIEGRYRDILQIMSTIKLAKVHYDWNKTCYGFNAFRWKHSESIYNLEGCSSLYFLQLRYVFDKRGAFEELQLESIQGNISFVGGLVISPKPILCYLGFYFDYKLNFHFYTYFYAIKYLFILNAMKILGNSSHEFLSI